MSDKYFKDKSSELFNQIFENNNIEEVKHIIYISIKEVARDQRYACVDAIRVDRNVYQREQNRLEMQIQNANIEYKEK